MKTVESLTALNTHSIVAFTCFIHALANRWLLPLWQIHARQRIHRRAQSTIGAKLTHAKGFKSGAIEHRRKCGERLWSIASRSERLSLTNQLQDAEVGLIAKATLVELDNTGVSTSTVSDETLHNCTSETLHRQLAITTLEEEGKF